MAIDTETKRKSILGFGTGDFLPHPDGTIAIGDRLTFLELYSGLTPQEPSGRLEYTIPDSRMEITIRKAVETTLDGTTEHTVEVP